jgi:hypothetical protein
MKLELNYAKLNGAYQVQQTEKIKGLELESKAKTIHSKSTRPFQALVSVEGKQKVAVIHPKFI